MKEKLKFLGLESVSPNVTREISSIQTEVRNLFASRKVKVQTKIWPPFTEKPVKESLFENPSPNISVQSGYPFQTLNTRHKAICNRGYCCTEIPLNLRKVRQIRSPTLRWFIKAWHRDRYRISDFYFLFNEFHKCFASWILILLVSGFQDDTVSSAWH